MEELHASVPLTITEIRHLNLWSASEKLILKCEQRLQVQIICKYSAGTVLMSTTSNLMSNILIIATHISSPPSVTTKTLPLPVEDWRVLCAPSAWVWRHISHCNFFLARKSQVWNSERLIKLCGWHHGLKPKSAATKTGWEREQLSVTFWTFWESQVLPHSLMFLFVPLVAVYILLYGKSKMFHSRGLFICALCCPSAQINCVGALWSE